MVDTRKMNIRGLKLLSLCMFVVLFVPSSKAQNGINSPYSQYGIGYNNMPYNFPAAAALGGVTYTRSTNNTINPFNPASYAGIGMESFVFDMGLGIDMTTLRKNDETQFDADGNISYLAFGFPLLKRWKTSLGVMPLSDVNYQSVQNSFTGPEGEVKTLYEGNGGVTQFFWGHAFNIIGSEEKSRTCLSAGFNLNYYYGTLTRAVTYDFTGSDTTYYMDSRRQKDTYIKNFSLDMGVQFYQRIGENYTFGAALTLKPHRTMRVTDNALVYTFVTNASLEYMRDTIFPERGVDSEYESTLEQPLTTGVGLSLQRDNKWLVAFDATYAPWSGMRYTENVSHNIFGDSPLRYGDTYSLAFGMQFMGDKNATNYLRRISLSAGAHYQSGKLSLQLAGTDYSLNEWGLGMGASLPMRKGRSVINISMSYSSFGTADLLRRDAFTIGISVSSCESWFVKRKFN